MINEGLERYDYYETRGGVFVMALKVKHSSQEPAHWLCPNCHERGYMSQLTPSDTQAYYDCPRTDCQASFKTNEEPANSGGEKGAFIADPHTEKDRAGRRRV